MPGGVLRFSETAPIDIVRRWALAPILGEAYVRDVPVAPEAVAARLRASLNVRPRRALGVLKIGAEWKGTVNGHEFVIWEKQQRTTRMVGRIRARRGGSRVEARLEVRRRTWLLLAVFMALFVWTSYGLLQRDTGMGLGPAGLATAALATVTMALAFWSFAMRQRAMLKAFLDRVLLGPERE